MAAKGTWQEQINKRTRNGKVRVDSADPRHFAVDFTIGSIHYRDNPHDETEQWKEIDSYFEPALAPWDWQMLKAGYHIRVKEDFTAGQIIEFEKEGETVQFQPMALEWTNDLDQIQSISMPQGVTPIISNPEVDLLPAVGIPSHQGTIRWNNAYGQGLDFGWRCISTRLIKILEIDSFGRLPVPEQYILDGGNPVLRLNLIFAPSGNIEIYVDGKLWDKKIKVQTFNVIEFRKDGEVLWGFMPLWYWGSGEGENNQGQSVATLEKRGNKLYTSIRVPYGWLRDVVYPIFIDTTVDEQVGASSDDAHEQESTGAMDLTNAEVYNYAATVNSLRYWGGYRWTGSFPSPGDTINVCYVEINIFSTSYDDIKAMLHFEKGASPPTFTTTTKDITNRTRTTNYADWIQNSLGTGWKQSPSLVTPLQEVVNSYSPTAIVLITKPYTDAFKYCRCLSYNYNTGGLAAKIHIEYTAGGGGWSGKISGVTNPAKVMGVDVANIAKVKGVA